MAIDLLFNILLFIFFGACLINVSTVSNLPDSDIMGAALWPQMILVLLLALLILNIYHTYKKNKADPEKTEIINGAIIAGFFKSKLFIGIAIIAVTSYLMDPLGFIISIFLFMCAYGYLLGQRSYVKLLVVSLITTLVLFFLFSKGLAVMLPRGYGIIREFSLMLETL